MAAHAERIDTHSSAPAGRLGSNFTGAGIRKEVDGGVDCDDLRNDQAPKLHPEAPGRALAMPAPEEERGRRVLKKSGGVIAGCGGEAISGDALEERFVIKETVAQDRVVDPVRGVHRGGALKGLEPGAVPIDARVRGWTVRGLRLKK